jgi:hypothetical protein
MSEAIKLIVDGYLSLKNRDALEDLVRIGSGFGNNLWSERPAASTRVRRWIHSMKICASLKPPSIGFESARGTGRVFLATQQVWPT